LSNHHHSHLALWRTQERPFTPERRGRGATRHTRARPARILSWDYFITSVAPRVGVPALQSARAYRSGDAFSRYTTGAMLKTTVLDTNWMGRARSIAAVLLESDGHRAILDPGPASTLPVLRQHLDSRGIAVSDLNAILLTHIHLDHAGATGALIKENPNLEVYVHKAGMLHMADPSKLLASAERLWPGELGHLFGETLPVPFGNLRMLKGGETLSLGSRNLEVFYTPGHASHHVSYFDASDGTAFVGDSTGFHIDGEGFVVPLAPPPDIDLEIWNASATRRIPRRTSRNTGKICSDGPRLRQKSCDPRPINKPHWRNSSWLRARKSSNASLPRRLSTTFLIAD
jgi:glyoxylase-like metal-dependent hydrolase (beta-lactamase superfamily II)